MTYLSHPVRRIHDEPLEGETVTLLVTAINEDGVDVLVDRLAEFGTVETRLRFATVKVTVPQEVVAGVCELSGVESIETASTLALDPDGAGEDVEFGGQ